MQDYEYILKKLDITENEFQTYLNAERVEHTHYEYDKGFKVRYKFYGKLRSFLNKKNVLIISPNFWGNVHITKHHYSLELHKLGANIFYLNPPSRSLGAFLKLPKFLKISR